jgi:hypothetical protein
MSINKYDELYNKFLLTIAEVHNIHLEYRRKPTYERGVRLRQALSANRELILELRAEIMDIRTRKRNERNNPSN